MDETSDDLVSNPNPSPSPSPSPSPNPNPGPNPNPNPISQVDDLEEAEAGCEVEAGGEQRYGGAAEHRAAAAFVSARLGSLADEARRFFPHERAITHKEPKTVGVVAPVPKGARSAPTPGVPRTP